MPQEAMHQETCEVDNPVDATTLALAEPSPAVCELCEEHVGLRPFPCRHLVCEACVLNMQCRHMYRCPFCRTPQQAAIPSSEFKLLKLLAGVTDGGVRESLLQSIKDVMRSVPGAVQELDRIVANSVQSMRDFDTIHLEPPQCLVLIAMLANGQLSHDTLREMLARPSSAAQRDISDRVEALEHG